MSRTMILAVTIDNSKLRCPRAWFSELIREGGARNARILRASHGGILPPRSLTVSPNTGREDATAKE